MKIQHTEGLWALLVSAASHTFWFPSSSETAA